MKIVDKKILSNIITIEIFKDNKLKDSAIKHSKGKWKHICLTPIDI